MPVTAIAGICGCTERTSRRRVNPSIVGMARSLTTMVGGHFRIERMASFASRAVRTSAPASLKNEREKLPGVFVVLDEKHAHA
jgi:hypothetical protein